MVRTFALFVVAVVTSMSAAATSARAAAPVHTWISIDETFTWDGCGFAVEEHDAGALHFISWYDASGDRTRETVLAPGFRITWTNPATGASVSSENPFVVHKYDNADGSMTVAFTGLAFALNGGGTAYVSSGREVIVFSDGSIEVVSSVGPSADLCAALEATIG